jgi:hypothetical protein
MSGPRNSRSVSIDFDECYVLTQQSAIASLQKEDLANKIEIMRLKQIIDTQNRTIHEHLNEKSSLKSMLADIQKHDAKLGQIQENARKEIELARRDIIAAQESARRDIVAAQETARRHVVAAQEIVSSSEIMRSSRDLFSSCESLNEMDKL